MLTGAAALPAQPRPRVCSPASGGNHMVVRGEVRGSGVSAARAGGVRAPAPSAGSEGEGGGLSAQAGAHRPGRAAPGRPRAGPACPWRLVAHRSPHQLSHRLGAARSAPLNNRAPSAPGRSQSLGRPGGSARGCARLVGWSDLSVLCLRCLGYK